MNEIKTIFPYTPTPLHPYTPVFLESGAQVAIAKSY
jgi:hypothetical protein